MRALFAAVLLALGLGVGAAPVLAQPLLSPEALLARLGASDLVVVDIRFGEKAAGARAFVEGHIPGAVHADYITAGWRALNKEGVTLYLPSASTFEVLAGRLGISNDSHVVIVHAGADDTDFGAAARVYWTFKAMGHSRVSILDGGFRAWSAEAARPIATIPRPIEQSLFEAKPDPSFRATLADVERAPGGNTLLLDSRPADFFNGTTKHKSVRVAGHIPGAANQSHALAFRPDARVKDVAALATAYATVPANRPVIAYCNTGHWAATNWFVLSELLGRKNVRMYDGSMLDYAADPARPVVQPAGR